jgi:hypothetical protein
MQGSLFDRGNDSGAVISSCGLYRYVLLRSWNPDLLRVNWIMLNPSTADHMIDDPTIRRCIGYTRAWGFGSLAVTNLFAFRATDPILLVMADDPIGPENDHHVREVAATSDIVVAAWGNHGTPRAREVLRLLRDMRITPHLLRVTGRGQPAHPLYLPADLVPVPMEDR